MKKNIFLFFLLLAAGLTACGNDTSGEINVSPAPSASVNTEQLLDNKGDVDVLTLGTAEAYDISPELSGIFFEDINHAADGGLYAEMIKNPSFEYGAKGANGALTGWGVTDKETCTLTIMNGEENGLFLNPSNPAYAEIDVQGSGDKAGHYSGLYNTGYLDGLYLEEGAEYKASFFCRMADGGVSPVRLSLKDKNGRILGESVVEIDPTDEWRYYETVLKASETASEKAMFCIEITAGLLDLDVISLMPVDTYKGLPIRKDLGEALEALNPQFLRFPGGCAIEGNSLDSMYSWKDSIANGESFRAGDRTFTGHVAARPQGVNLWGGSRNDPYYMSYGLGFYEFFELCEALDAVAVPVLNAGMTCPIQSRKYTVFSENSEEFKQTVQDVLDLCEFCRGGADSVWGSVRIAMGHPEPFKLKYIGIGNEQWQREYFSHYARIEEALMEAAAKDPKIYGDIGLVLSNGPSSGSREGWDYLKNTGSELAAIVDEHYYELPDWFLQNNDRYDKYGRNYSAKVFLGEYAAKSNTLRAALAEASFMTALERNGDVVALSCYAPLFGNTTDRQWDPDLIYFNRKEHYLTADYYVQQLFGTNAGQEYIPSELTLSSYTEEASLSGGIGLGSWQTAVSYDNVKVTSNATGEVLYEGSFDSSSDVRDEGWIAYKGSWQVKDGAYVQNNVKAPADESTGDAAYLVNKDWKDYTFEADGTILDGAEGFLIPVCVQDTKNMIFWNIGGWGNTVSCLQTVTGGLKSGQEAGTVRSAHLKKNAVYHIKVVVSKDNIKCYLDDTLYVDYTVKPAQPLYHSVVRDEDGSVIIKLVNMTETGRTISLEAGSIDPGMFSDKIELAVLSGESFEDKNSFAEPDRIAPEYSVITRDDLQDLILKPRSLTVIRMR